MVKRQWQQGWTLIEGLMLLMVIAILSMLTIPTWRNSIQQFYLYNEQQRLHTFLRLVQSRAENSSHIWYLVANRNAKTKQWCLVAQLKSDKVCDCLQPTFCDSELQAIFYIPFSKGETMLLAKKYYPEEMIRFSGIRDTAQTNCFVLQAGNTRTVFSFFNIGSLRLKSYQSASACVSDSLS